MAGAVVVHLQAQARAGLDHDALDLEARAGGVKEMYKSLGTPIDAVVEGVRAMKSVAVGLLAADDASEAAAYFDYVIGAMS